MRRHVIVGRFGSGDRVRVPAAPHEFSTRVNLVTSNRRLDYGIGRALDDLRSLGVFPSEIGLDLLVLAALVHAADTRISRATESQDTWTRELRLVVPVSEPALWMPLSSTLRQMLNFLTGDRWIVGFRSRPRRFSTAVRRRPRDCPQPPFDSVTLFSGGLDSLIGAIDVLEAGGTPLLASHAGEGATSDAQNACFAALKSHYTQQPFDRLRLWMSFPRTLVRDSGTESTTRGRSFLFFALGAFAGTGLGRPFTVRVPENALIALNVPLDRLRLGSLSTRTTHPFYMTAWNELLVALGIPGQLENPYWNKTKGEMINGCANASLLRDLIARSLSCSSPTKSRWQGRGVEHCGYCVPCIIRRAAIEAALGPGNDPTTYTVPNLTGRVLDTCRSEGQQVRSFQLAIERIKARPHLAAIFIHKPGPLPHGRVYLDELADVYRRGLEEVAALLDGVQAGPN